MRIKRSQLTKKSVLHLEKTCACQELDNLVICASVLYYEQEGQHGNRLLGYVCRAEEKKTLTRDSGDQSDGQQITQHGRALQVSAVLFLRPGHTAKSCGLGTILSSRFFFTETVSVTISHIQELIPSRRGARSNTSLVIGVCALGRPACFHIRLKKSTATQIFELYYSQFFLTNKKQVLSSFREPELPFPQVHALAKKIPKSFGQI